MILSGRTAIRSGYVTTAKSRLQTSTNREHGETADDRVDSARIHVERDRSARVVPTLVRSSLCYTQPPNLVTDDRRE